MRHGRFARRLSCVVSVLAISGAVAIATAPVASGDPNPVDPEDQATPPAPPPGVTAQSTMDVTDEASWRAALTALAADNSGPHTINILNSFDLTAGVSDPVYDGTQDLTINGNGFTIDATGASKILDNDFVGTPITITINDLTLLNGTDDLGDEDGGAVETENRTIVNNTVFRDNHAEDNAGSDGGAIDAGNGGVAITNSVFEDNTSEADGGAVDTGDSGTISQSTFAGNTATDGDGGAVDTSNLGADLLVVRSTFNGNTAGTNGGAMQAEGNVDATNTTITDNTSTNGGGGIDSVDGNVTLNYVTVVFNHDPIASDLTGEGDLSSFASLVGGNGGGVNCVFNGATIASSYNFAEDDSCDFTGTGDQQNTPDPMIGDLADNGGPTQTMLPQAGSPLIDQIPSSSPCAGVVILTDQRGILRPQGTACDIGAVEVEVEVVAAVAVTPTFTG